MKYSDDTPSSLLVIDEENPMFPKIGIWSISPEIYPVKQKDIFVFVHLTDILFILYRFLMVLEGFLSIAFWMSIWLHALFPWWKSHINI